MRVGSRRAVGRTDEQDSDHRGTENQRKPYAGCHRRSPGNARSQRLEQERRSGSESKEADRRCQPARGGLDLQGIGPEVDRIRPADGRVHPEAVAADQDARGKRQPQGERPPPRPTHPLPCPGDGDAEDEGGKERQALSGGGRQVAQAHRQEEPLCDRAVRDPVDVVAETEQEPGDDEYLHDAQETARLHQGRQKDTEKQDAADPFQPHHAVELDQGQASRGSDTLRPAQNPRERQMDSRDIAPSRRRDGALLPENPVLEQHAAGRGKPEHDQPRVVRTDVPRRFKDRGHQAARQVASGRQYPRLTHLVGDQFDDRLVRQIERPVLHHGLDGERAGQRQDQQCSRRPPACVEVVELQQHEGDQAAQQNGHGDHREQRKDRGQETRSPGDEDVEDRRSEQRKPGSGQPGADAQRVERPELDRQSQEPPEIEVAGHLKPADDGRDQPGQNSQRRQQIQRVPTQPLVLQLEGRRHAKRREQAEEQEGAGQEQPAEALLRTAPPVVAEQDRQHGPALSQQSHRAILATSDHSPGRLSRTSSTPAT